MKRIAWNSITLAGLMLAVGCTAGSGSGSGSNGDGGLGSGLGGDGDGTGSGTGDGMIGFDGGGNASAGMVVDQPSNCDDAAASRSYIGCEFWPTVTPNPVFTEFDFAVVIANPQEAAVNVTVTGPGAFSQSVSIAPGGLETIKLPWVADLKGPLYNANTSGGRLQTSLSMEKGAYRVQSDAPVAAYQFNPLQYEKPAAECGSIMLSDGQTECRGASNDATILLPTTALTGNYRVGVWTGSYDNPDAWASTPGAFAITATTDGTSVQVQVPPGCDSLWGADSAGCVAAGGLVPAAVANDILEFTMNAGDVIAIQGAQYVGAGIPHADLSGSVINATQPVQVIAFNAIVMIPEQMANADHIEETVLPAEVIGNEYVVAPPSKYGGGTVGHKVRIYGNVDGTVLEYPAGKPDGAPDMINAGEMVELPPRVEASARCGAAGANHGDQCPILNEAFVVKGNQPFSVASFMLGGKIQTGKYAAADPAEPGDPAMTMMVTPEQFRQEYTFLAPVDFMENYADMTIPTGAEVILDGTVVADPGTPIDGTPWSIVRVLLGDGVGGVHTLTTTNELGVGLQVSGFGKATSYYYPGGLDLRPISEPPVIIVK